MRTLALGFFLVFVSALAQAKNAAPPAEMYLMDSSVLAKMTDLERAEYFEALRDFMTKNNERLPDVSQMMLDELLGLQSANAQVPTRPVISTNCMKGNQILSKGGCYGEFYNAARNGELGACSNARTVQDGSTYYSTITCGGQDYRYAPDRPAFRSTNQAAADTQTSSMQTYWIPQSEKAAQRRQQDASSADAPNVPAAPASSGTDAGTRSVDRPTPASGSAAAGAASGPGAAAAQENWISHRERGQSARCFFAGFSIGRADKKARCSPITKLCDDNPRMKGMRKEQLKKIMGCPEAAAKAQCGGSAASTPAARGASATIRQNQNASSQIPCNPVLYGLKDDAVICVSKKSNASEECARKADEGGLKKILEKEEGKLAFNQMLESIKTECRSYWRLDGETVVARGGTGESREGDSNSEDFKKTCKTLVERVIAIGGSIAKVKTDTDFRKMVEAFQNTANNPDFVGPAAPNRGGSQR